MNLLVFRHGTAAPFPLGLGGDAERPLTKEGRGRFEVAARAWALFAPRPDIVLTSPLLRAQQTAELLAKAFGCAPPVIEETIVPEGSPDDLFEVLPNEPCVCIVSHMPFVGDLIGEILTGSPSSHVGLRPGSGVWVEVDAHHVRRGRLAAALTQKSARKLAEKLG